MKKDKCNSRESWFLHFMPENHDLHPNFIEIPFINVSKDFLDTMTLTLWDFKQWWSLPHFCIISLSYFPPNLPCQLLNRSLCFSSSTSLSNIDVSGHYIQLFSLLTKCRYLLKNAHFPLLSILSSPLVLMSGRLVFVCWS